MGARLVHSVGGLSRDLEAAAVSRARAGREAVRDAAEQGNRIAKSLARRSSGRHARLYPGTFSVGRSRVEVGVAYEYGPEARGQGLLAPILERGSRNNAPHLDLAQSADVVGVYGTFGARVERMLDDLL